jgi:hypothetical protein
VVSLNLPRTNYVETEVLNDIVDDRWSHASYLFRVSDQERVLANGADQAGNPSRMAIHGRNRFGWEHGGGGGVGSGCVQPPFDIPLGLVCIQGPKLRTKGDSLLELSKPVGIQLLIQFWLSDEHNLQ